LEHLSRRVTKMQYVLMISGARCTSVPEAVWTVLLHPDWMSVAVDDDHVDGSGSDDALTALCLVDCRDIDDAIRIARRISTTGRVEIRPVERSG